MKVLDVGSGAGDVAMLAARLVGPTGSVIGLDANPDILRLARQWCITAGLTHVTLLDGDLRTVVLDNDFDAIVGRFVLLYLPDPAPSIAFVSDASSTERCRRISGSGVDDGAGVPAGLWLSRSCCTNLELVCRRAPRLRGQPCDGFSVYQTYQQAGLGVPQMEYHALLDGPAAWAGYDMIAELFRSILPLLEKYGLATAKEVGVDTLADQYQAMAAQIEHPFIVSPCVTALAQVRKH